MDIKINEIKIMPPTEFTPDQLIEEKEINSPSMLALQELQETTGQRSMRRWKRWEWR
ncbi:type III secretion system protein SsaL [Salmonella enterica subsp. arizonae]|uniref:Type III secretion system protein SsaL n=1 Tax=Salmonella enterica subsp. arizonae TaxID=59203 RepID=A0A379SVE7_SALER|nr:type III secretion system protein SsaL [Salmonella enterica subsp. arizonae]